MAEMIERHGQLVDADWWEAQRTRVRRIIECFEHIGIFEVVLADLSRRIQPPRREIVDERIGERLGDLVGRVSHDELRQIDDALRLALELD